MSRNAAPPKPEPQTLAFADYQLHPQERRLLKDGEPERIGERAFDLLCLLAAPRLGNLPDDLPAPMASGSSTLRHWPAARCCWAPLPMR